MNVSKELLQKVASVQGLCSEEEILCAMDYYMDLNKKLGLYLAAHNYLPQGLTVPYTIKNLEYYVKRFEESK